jgi:hypothetical protein
MDNKPLDQMDFWELRKLREQYPYSDQLSQRVLAPYEHRQFAKQMVMDKDPRALLLPLMIPGYQAFKKAGMLSSRSGDQDSTEQMLQGFAGMGDGIAALAKQYGMGMFNDVLRKGKK